MYWFEAGSAPIFVHDFKVTLAGYVVCIMFISDLSVFSIIWYAGIWWFVWSWKYWRILYNQYMRFLEVLCVLCPSTVSFSREWGSRSIPAYFNRVWIAGKKGLFPVVDKSNFFFKYFLQDQPVCWFGLRQTLLEMCLYEVSYLMVQYRKWVYNRKECMARAAS